MLVLGTISRSTRRRAVRAGAPARATRRSWKRSGWPPRCAPEGPTPTPPWRWTRWAGTSTGSEAERASGLSADAEQAGAVGRRDDGDAPGSSDAHRSLLAEHAVPAVHVQERPGDERRLVGAQPDRSIRLLGRVGHPLHRDRGGDRLVLLRRGVLPLSQRG